MVQPDPLLAQLARVGRQQEVQLVVLSRRRARWSLALALAAAPEESRGREVGGAQGAGGGVEGGKEGLVEDV